MKLRTRILLITCAALLAASLAGDILILRVMENSMKNEARVNAYQNFYELLSELAQDLRYSAVSVEKASFLTYYLKSLKDDYTICFEKQPGDDSDSYTEIYNHTVLTLETLQGLNYQSYNSLEYADYTQDGENYGIFRKESEDGILMLHIVAMKDVEKRVHQIAAAMLAITMAAAGVMLVILSIVLSHLLRPLQELNETTKRLAAGDYASRLPVRRSDELGQLEDSFNKMAEAVEISTRNLEESEKRKTLFMGNLTHELKTPMTAISGYAQTLLSTKISRENQEAALLYIYEECGRLERLSKKMMKLLELEQDTELSFTDTPVEQLFEASAAACRVLLEEKQITLECSQKGEHFNMDVDLMTDVLINLIDNAVKASDAGGKILLRAYGDCIEVQDFGRGIPAEEQEKILEPFYMIDKSRSRQNGGAGLGLALVAVILKKHGVSMRIESSEGVGTRMILQFV